MTVTDLIALSPILALGTCCIVTMLVIALRRNHATTAVTTAVGPDPRPEAAPPDFSLRPRSFEASVAALGLEPSELPRNLWLTTTPATKARSTAMRNRRVRFTARLRGRNQAGIGARPKAAPTIQSCSLQPRRKAGLEIKFP